MGDLTEKSNTGKPEDIMSSHLVAMSYMSKERVAERQQAADAYRQTRKEKVSESKTRPNWETALGVASLLVAALVVSLA